MQAEETASVKAQRADGARWVERVGCGCGGRETGWMAKRISLSSGSVLSIWLHFILAWQA